MLIYSAIASGQGAVARRWSSTLREQQAVLHTAAYGDDSYQWVWGFLTKVLSPSPGPPPPFTPPLPST